MATRGPSSSCRRAADVRWRPRRLVNVEPVADAAGCPPRCPNEFLMAQATILTASERHLAHAASVAMLQADAGSAAGIQTDAYPELDAMAELARRTGCVVHLVLPRGRGIAEQARAVAQTSGLDVAVDLTARTIRVRYSVDAEPTAAR